MNLTDHQYAEAARELGLVGIQDSDLESSLAGVCALCGDTGYQDWLITIKSATPEALLTTYGHDLIRAVLAFRKQGA